MTGDQAGRVAGRPARSGVGPITGALGRLAELGKPGAFVGRELDLVRVLGVRHAWTRLSATEAELLAPTARARLYRRIWEDAADRVGAELRELPSGFLEIRRGDHVTRVREHLVAIDDPVTLAIAGDKPLVHGALTDAGLPVPRHEVVRIGDTDAAATFVETSAPCVVKPASQSGRGDGVTGFVASRSDLIRASLRSVRHDPERLLVEAQAAGPEYRVLVLDGEPVGAVQRDPPHVTGDGSSTIIELVDAENRRRVTADGEAGLRLLELDLDALFTMREQGLSLRAVPRAGRRVRVRSGTSQGSEQDAQAVPVGDPHHAGICAAAREAARIVGARLATVEMITQDPSAELGSSGGVILEINTTPGLAQHYLVANPDAAEPVAEVILSRLLSD